MRRLTLSLTIALLVLAPAGASADGVIVGGGETATAWPFMGYLETGREEIETLDTQYCGASLIAPTWVMSAAHCVTADARIDPPLTTFVVGRHEKSNADTGERIQVKRIVVHEDYGSPGAANDVALFELSHAPASAKPVQVANAFEEPLWAPGQLMTIIGWGTTSEGGSGSDALKEAQVPIVADAECAKLEEDFHAPTMVCAGYAAGGTDTCQGDSGGPMLAPAADGTWRQVGITSWGDGCAQAEHPGVYTRIAGAALRAWLADKVPAAISTSAGAPPAATPTPAPAPAGAPPPASGSAPSGTPNSTSESSSRSAAARRTAKAKARKRARARCRAAKRAAKTKRAKRRAAKLCAKARRL